MGSLNGYIVRQLRALHKSGDDFGLMGALDTSHTSHWLTHWGRVGRRQGSGEDDDTFPVGAFPGAWGAGACGRG